MRGLVGQLITESNLHQELLHCRQLKRARAPIVPPTRSVRHPRRPGPAAARFRHAGAPAAHRARGSCSPWYRPPNRARYPPTTRPVFRSQPLQQLGGEARILVIQDSRVPRTLFAVILRRKAMHGNEDGRPLLGAASVQFSADPSVVGPENLVLASGGFLHADRLVARNTG